jgi:hypothetical protein
MAENDKKREERTQGSAVILGEAVFRRLSMQNAARAEARRYLEAARRTALQRRLVMRILRHRNPPPGLHSVE